MRFATRRIWQANWFKLGIIGSAVIIYNNWLLGLWLNSRLFNQDGSVSEFSVTNQPHHWVFRALDITAGCLLVLAARLFVKELGGSRRGRLILALTIVLGAANVADAVNILPCSDTLSRQCVVPVQVSWTNYQVPPHAYSSIIIAACYFLLPLVGWLWASQRRLRLASVACGLMVLLATESFISALVEYLRKHALSVHTSGAGQEVQMLIFAAWLLAFYWLVVHFGGSGSKAGKPIGVSNEAR